MSTDTWEGVHELARDIERLGRRAAVVLGDVGAKDDADRIVDDAVRQIGPLDILVNNAAAPHGPDRNWTWLVPEEAFDEVMRVNTKGVFLVSAAMIRHLLDRSAASGRIINIASGAGRRGLPQRAAYCASKFATIGLTQVMAIELAPHGITVNAVCPGAINTSRYQARANRAESDAADAAFAALVALDNPPVGRIGEPEDIARAVLFLSEKSADFITGQAVNIDGGFMMA
jgi:NAD(P)-dependent dehydrogenase (short-subunit alcohol dehydrogenase family)